MPITVQGMGMRCRPGKYVPALMVPTFQGEEKKETIDFVNE